MRIGIYGGTFSPVHNGHVIMAESFLAQMQLDRLYVIPTFLPPHKTEVDGADVADRLSMLELAFAGKKGIEVSDIEIKRGSRSYTVDTLRQLKGLGELYFLCGSDMFLTLDKWREPAEIFRLAHIVLGRRERSCIVGHELEECKKAFEKKYGARIHEIFFPVAEVSSSMIRENLRMSKPIDGLVPDAVERYIAENRLYR